MQSDVLKKEKPARKKTGGRRPGARNRTSQELRELARQYSPESLQRLVYWMRQSKNAGASLEACRQILDRGHGKPIQPLHHEGQVTITHEEAISIIAARVAEIEAKETIN